MRPPADEAENPQVNVGTGTMDRARWAPVVDRFIADLRAYDFPGGRLDVRENVKFRGGHFSRWVHETFPADRVCAGDRVQEVLHGRVDRRSQTATSSGRSATHCAARRPACWSSCEHS